MRSLRARLMLSHIGLALLLVAIIGLSLVYVLESQVVLVNLSTQLNRQASLLAEMSADYPLVWSDQVAAQAFVDRFSGRMTAQFMLLNADGRVLASSDPSDQALVGQLLTHPDLGLVRAGENSTRTEYSQDLRTEIADILIPAIDESGQVAGMVRLTHQLATTQERFLRLRALVVQILSVSLALGILLAILLAWQLEKPVQYVTLAIYRLASGDDPAQLPVKGPSEIQLLIASFNNLVERLRVLRITRGQLIANLVHEMGRPLGALRLANQALLDGADEDPALRRQMLQGVEGELKSLQLLLEDLVAYYDHASGERALDFRPTDISLWLSYLGAPWAQAARAKGLSWETAVPAVLPKVVIDPDRLGQVLGNLIENAIKYTPPGGTVSLAAGHRDGEIWIRVSDNGQGIALVDQNHIFEPFFRSSEASRIPEGMGLGLTIARDLVLAHHGRLDFTSEPGAGSHFTIWLPTGGGA